MRWYVEALGRAVQALAEGKDAAAVIRNDVDNLSEAKVRNVLQLKLADDAARTLAEMEGEPPSRN